MAISVNERQARYKARKRKQRLALPYIPCACGCGELIPPINSMGKPTQFKVGHHSRVQDTGGRFQKGQIPWNKGIPCRPETKCKLSNIKKGRESPNKGKHASEETRMKLSLSHKGQPSPLKGRHLPQETKDKISKTLKGRKLPPEVIQKISGSNHHGWRGGIGTLPYGPEFTRKFKRLIRERDGNTCQLCGKPRSKHWRELEVHHIDHDKMNNDSANLITICNRCHIWVNNHHEESLILFSKHKMPLH